MPLYNKNSKVPWGTRELNACGDRVRRDRFAGTAVVVEARIPLLQWWECQLQFEEPPAGNGYADVVYIPKPDSDWPVLVIELKWNKEAEGVIQQILDKKYPAAFDNCGRPVLLVGISYDRDEADGKRHSCRIVEYEGGL